MNMEEGSHTSSYIRLPQGFQQGWRLIHSLEFYEIQGKISKWIECFLANMTQAIVLEGENSKVTNVHLGVLQGSVLGPYLFLFYRIGGLTLISHTSNTTIISLIQIFHLWNLHIKGHKITFSYKIVYFNNLPYSSIKGGKDHLSVHHSSTIYHIYNELHHGCINNIL